MFRNYSIEGINLQLKKDKRDAVFSLRIGKALRNKIFKEARKRGMTLSTFIRIEMAKIVKQEFTGYGE